MTQRCRTASDRIVPLLLTAVVSLTIAQSLDLGHQLLGSGPGSTVAIVGNVAGLVGCAVSAWLGVRARRDRAYRGALFNRSGRPGGRGPEGRGQ